MALKECLYLLWDELKVLTYAPDMTNTSIIEFTQALSRL